MNTSSPFFNVRQQAVTTRLGRVMLPIRYYDVSTVLFFFWVPFDLTEEMIADSGINACRFFNKKALCGLAFYEYRDSDIGAYNEVALATAVHHRDEKRPRYLLADFLKPVAKRRVGFYIHHLPVTTERACVAGKEIWGFPKFTTALPFHLSGKHFAAGVEHPEGGKLFSIETDFSAGMPVTGFDLLLYSRHGQRQLRTHVTVKSLFTTCRPTSFKWSMGEKDHEMLSTLKRLSLDGRKPFLAQYTTHFQSLLHAGREITGHE